MSPEAPASQALFEQRLRERTRAAGLPDTAAGTASRFFNYYALMTRWNRRMNLTALPLTDDPQAETLDRLFVESLVAGQHVPRHLEGLWFDLGSGGGSPAIPLNIVCPWLSLTMVESRSKKAAFLREAIRELGLDRATVSEARVETLPGRYAPRSAALITVRGVRLDDMVFSVAAELLRLEGQLMLFGTEPDGVWDRAHFRLLDTGGLPGSGCLLVLERSREP